MLKVENWLIFNFLGSYSEKPVSFAYLKVEKPLDMLKIAFKIAAVESDGKKE